MLPRPDVTKSERASLKRKSADGAAISLAAQVLKLVVQLFYQILLARLLSPGDFGLVAMVAPVLAIIQLFSDLGLSQATVQRATIAQGQLSLLFWVNVGASIVFGLITIGLSPLVGMFYGEAKVVAVTAVSGAMFLFSGLSSQHLALMNRNLAFVRLATIELSALILGAATGLICAARGFGYWSILAGQWAIVLVTLTLAWTLSTWRPGRPQGGEHWRNLIGFGANLTGFNLVNYLARNLDNVLIGKFIGRDALGLYDRAYRLMLLPLSQISQPMSRVALPILARTVDDAETYRKVYTRTLDSVLLLTYPFVVFAVIAHEQLILTVLGNKWAAVAPIFAVLGVGAFFAPIGNSTGWLFMSQNRTRQMRNWGAAGSALFVAAFIAGLPWGPIGVAVCYVGVGIVFQGPLVLWAATREGPVRLSHVLRGLFPHVVSIIISGALEFGLQRIVGIGMESLVALFLFSYVVYLASLAITRDGRKVLAMLWEYGRPALVRLRLVH